MTVTNIKDIRNELMQFFRNNVTDPKSRAPAGSLVFTGTGSTTQYVLNQPNVTNITSITIGGSAQRYGFDYSVDYKNSTMVGSPTVTFNTAPHAGSQGIINYKNGSCWLFPDYPRDDISLDSYPRMCALISASREEVLGVGATAINPEYLVSIIAFAEKTETVDDLLQEARSGLIANMKTFYSFPYIQPIGYGPMGKNPERHDKISSRNLDAVIKFIIDK